MLKRLLTPDTEPVVLRFLIEHCGVPPQEIGRSACSTNAWLMRELQKLVHELAALRVSLCQLLMQLLDMPRPLLDITCSYLPLFTALEAEDKQASTPLRPAGTKFGKFRFDIAPLPRSLPFSFKFAASEPAPVAASQQQFSFSPAVVSDVAHTAEFNFGGFDSKSKDSPLSFS